MRRPQPVPEIVECRFTLPVDTDAAFAFFCDPRKLDAVTPPWFGPRLRGAPPSRLQVGTTIDYAMKWHGLPLRWRSVITHVDRPVLLTYQQSQGPFRTFRHDHIFESVPDGVEIVDRIAFTAPFIPPVSSLLKPLLRRQLANILTWRARRSEKLLSGSGGDVPGRAGP